MFSIMIRKTELGQPRGPWGEAGSKGEEPEFPDGDAPPVAEGGARDIAPPDAPGDYVETIG